MKGLGEIEVEADWGTRGAGAGQPDCAPLGEHACQALRGCGWDAANGRCAWEYDLAIALSEVADLVGGNWIAVERAGECVQDSTASLAAAVQPRPFAHPKGGVGCVVVGGEGGRENASDRATLA